MRPHPNQWRRKRLRLPNAKSSQDCAAAAASRHHRSRAGTRTSSRGGSRTEAGGGTPQKRHITAVKFRQIKEDERVQFNKRVTRRVADGFEMLAIRSRKKVPALLSEALELLEERYGKVG